jgi:hypothetical protein
MTESEKEEKRLGRPGYRWENSEVDSKEIGWNFVDWIHLAPYQMERACDLVKVALELRVS